MVVRHNDCKNSPHEGDELDGAVLRGSLHSVFDVRV